MLDYFSSSHIHFSRGSGWMPVLQCKVILQSVMWMNHASVFISHRLANFLIFCCEFLIIFTVLVNWLDGIYYEMFCITLCYVFVHFAGFVSDNWSKCALIYVCIRDSIVCLYWFCCDVYSRFGISRCFFHLERAKLCTNRDFSGNVSYSGLVFSKEIFAQ